MSGRRSGGGCGSHRTSSGTCIGRRRRIQVHGGVERFQFDASWRSGWIRSTSDHLTFQYVRASASEAHSVFSCTVLLNCTSTKHNKKKRTNKHGAHTAFGVRCFPCAILKDAQWSISRYTHTGTHTQTHTESHAHTFTRCFANMNNNNNNIITASLHTHTR